MQSENLEQDLEQLDKFFHKSGLSRRDALKMIGLSGGMLLTKNSLNASTSINNNLNAKGKVVIVGGGLAGMSTAVELAKKLKNPDITIIEPQDNACSYQPGQIFVATGLWQKKDIIYKTDSFIPYGVKIIKEKVIEFIPDNNTLITDRNQTIKYDFLVVAMGVKLNYAAIKGLEELTETYSVEDNKEMVKVLDSLNISSLYTIDTAEATWKNLNKVFNLAQKGKKVNIISSEPNSLIKCNATPKEILYLINSNLNKLNIKSNTVLNFYSNVDSLCEIRDYNNAMISQFKQRDIKWNSKHNLIEVKKNLAIFENENNDKVEVEFDFLHITPPMKAPDEVGKSKLALKSGWVDVDLQTLQHKKYSNIFALGDVINSKHKTGSAIRKQYKIVVDNLLSMMSIGYIPTSNIVYDGYTVCPIATDINKVMLAQFNWASKKSGSGRNCSLFSSLDPTKERYIWWLVKFYLLKPMVVQSMLRGKH